MEARAPIVVGRVDLAASVKELRKAATKEDEAALKALLDAKVVNIEGKDSFSVSGWGEWIRGAARPVPPLLYRGSGRGGAVHESARNNTAL